MDKSSFYYPVTSDRAFYQQLKAKLEREPVVLATIVKVTGSAPREVGAKMMICQAGTIIGTIGGGAGEGKVIQQALSVLETGRNQLVNIDLTGAPGRDIQGVCGGTVQVWLARIGEEAIALVEQILHLLATGKAGKLVTPLAANQPPYLVTEDRSDRLPHHTPPADYFVETIEPPPRLLIVGGGHVAAALARVASIAGFQIAVQDERPEFVTSQRFPQALLLPMPITEALNRLTRFSPLYIALVTRGYQQDLIAMQSILERPLAYQYVGAIGSQKRIRMICQALQRQEIPREKLKHFYAPIGLDIGALTPEEIAVSICAELIKVRRGGTGLSLSERMQSTLAQQKVHL
ncbi:MAG: XdhC family protein [Cyanophyceae cyanobacterium]